MGIARAEISNFVLQHCKSAFNILEEAIAQAVKDKLIYPCVSETS
jgi:hypothetical protein